MTTYNTDIIKARNMYDTVKQNLALAKHQNEVNNRPIIDEPSGGGLLGVGGAGQRRLKGGAFVIHPTQRPPVQQFFLKQQLIKKG